MNVYTYPEYASLPDSDKQKIEQLIIEVKSHTPWQWEGSIWDTKAKYFSWLRGALRSIWSRKWVFKNNYLNSHSFLSPSLDKDGNLQYYKSGKKKGEVVQRKSFKCEITGEILPIKQAEVDHISPSGSCNDGLEACIFLFRLLTPTSNMRLISKEVHKVITYAERMKIPFEEALIEKKIIEKCKQKTNVQIKELLSAGFKEGEVSNGSKRKECYRKLLKK